MKYFYGKLAAGQSKSEALRRAMLQLRQDYAHQKEGSPIIRMGVVLSELEHGAAQCLAFGLPGRQFAIEVLHEIGGRSVIDVPETDDHGRGACIQKTTHQSEQFVSRDDTAEAGTAAAQSDQAGLRAELVYIEK